MIRNTWNILSNIVFFERDRCLGTKSNPLESAGDFFIELTVGSIFYRKIVYQKNQIGESKGGKIYSINKYCFYAFTDKLGSIISKILWVSLFLFDKKEATKLFGGMFALGLLLKITSLFNRANRDLYTQKTKPFSIENSIEEVLKNPKKNASWHQTYEIFPILPVLIPKGEEIGIPPFGECSCTNNNFNRIENDRRSRIEKRMLEKTLSSFPAESIKELRYLSLGSGELFQEVVNIGKLILSGYKRIHVALVDPEISHDLVRAFRYIIQKFAKEHGAEVAVHGYEKFGDIYVWYNNVNPFQRNPRDNKYHILSAIDYDIFPEDNAYADFFMCMEHLEKNGRAFLSVDKLDFILKEKKLEYLDLVEDEKNSQKGMEIREYIAKELNQIPDEKNICFYGIIPACGFATVLFSKDTEEQRSQVCLKIIEDNAILKDKFVKMLNLFGFKKIEFFDSVDTYLLQATTTPDHVLICEDKREEKSETQLIEKFLQLPQTTCIYNLNGTLWKSKNREKEILYQEKDRTEN